MNDDDKNVYPRFYIKSVQNNAASEKQGRPIFRDVEYVEVIIAGDKNSRPHFKVSDVHRERWPKQYEAFKRGQELIADGTPLKQWPILTPAQIDEFIGLGIYTVEALAEIPDSLLDRLGMGARKIREKAKTWLSDAEKNAENARMASEIVGLQEEIKLLKDQLREQARHAAIAAKKAEREATQEYSAPEPDVEDEAESSLNFGVM